MSHYEILGIPKDATPDMIRKAYHRMALKNHPDKGGDPEIFKSISEAKEVLSDPNKRKLYDTYGKDFEKHNGDTGGNHPHGFSMNDMGGVFGSFFGGINGVNMGFRGPPPPKQPKQTKHTISLPLEDFYNGKTVKRAVSRLEKCDRCDGKGGSKIHENKCISCSGNGFRVSQAGGGLSSMFHSRVKCQSCQGVGTSRRIENPCSKCEATGKITIRVIIEPSLKPGDKPGTRCVFPGLGNYTGDSPTGDIVITINPKPSEFNRRGNDLYIEREITLKQCLTGFEIDIKHLDGRIVQVKPRDGKVTSPGAIIKLQGEGIPRNHGSLFVTFSVKFPERLDKDTMEKLSSIL